jgi:hypothetical protein
MNKGLVVALAIFEEEPDDKVTNVEVIEEFIEDDDGCSNYLYDIPPNVALVGYYGKDPTMLDKAMQGPDAKRWQEALEYKISQLEKLGTWEIVDLPQGHMAIPCNEVVRVKRGPDGKVQSYRVRIVAGGHKQVEGVNYSETFSAAAKMLTVCAVLANMAHQNWEIEHVDVKSVYLNTPLKEEIYIKAPRGVLKPGQEGKVLRLLKGLYGLKQSG